MEIAISIDLFDDFLFSKENKFLLLGITSSMKKRLLDQVSRYIEKFSNRTIISIDPIKNDLYSSCNIYRKYSPLLNKRIISQNYINFILFDDISFIKSQIIDFYKMINVSDCLFIDVKKELKEYNCVYDYIFISSESEDVLKIVFEKYSISEISLLDEFIEIVLDCLDNDEILIIDVKNKSLLYMSID
jgi:hypothetical protein